MCRYLLTVVQGGHVARHGGGAQRPVEARPEGLVHARDVAVVRHLACGHQISELYDIINININKYF